MLNTLHHPAADVMPVAGCALASSVRSSADASWPLPLQATRALPRAASAAGASTEATRAVVLRFMDLLYHRHQVRAAFECCVVAQGFRDHAWHGRGSRAGVIKALARPLGDPALRAELLNLAVDGALAMAHLRCQRGDAPPQERVEIYRVADGRIAEHWSIGTPTLSPA